MFIQSYNVVLFSGSAVNFILVVVLKGTWVGNSYKIGDKSSLNNITEHNKCKILTQLSKYNHIEIKTDSLI